MRSVLDPGRIFSGWWVWILYGLFYIVIGVFTIIGALSGLKYQRGGSVLCLITGIMSLSLVTYYFSFIGFRILYGSIIQILAS